MLNELFIEKVLKTLVQFDKFYEPGLLTEGGYCMVTAEEMHITFLRLLKEHYHEASIS